MKIQSNGDTLRISDVKEINADNASRFREQASAALSNGERNIEVDFSETRFLDSSGLGALVALHKAACNREGALRLVNPTPPVRQILELTRLHHVFEIVRR